jgi:hypothetical protein
MLLLVIHTKGCLPSSNFLDIAHFEPGATFPDRDVQVRRLASLLLCITIPITAATLPLRLRKEAI